MLMMSRREARQCCYQGAVFGDGNDESARDAGLAEGKGWPT